MAHPDLAKIFGQRPARGSSPSFTSRPPTSSRAAGVAVEVSTAGLRKPVGEIYPDESFLAACHRHGVPITTASDAHDAGSRRRASFDQALALARRVGYETVSVFEGRRAAAGAAR